MIDEKQFPEGMTPLGADLFPFDCHPRVSCFTVCCRNVDLDLYPYDIIRLKKLLGIDSRRFLESYTRLETGHNPFFPTVKLKLVPYAGAWACPFLQDQGCSVYSDRPTACRTYPLERAVDREQYRGRCRDWYFLTRHEYCRGHEEAKQVSARQWVRSQQLDSYNLMNDLWSAVDTLLASNPFKGEGSGGPRQQLAFLACYDIDGFRQYAAQQQLLESPAVDRDRRRRISRSDDELLKFAFQWLSTALR